MKNKTKPDSSNPLSGYEMATRHLVMEKDLNYFGNLFGGTVLSWLDEGTAAWLIEQIGYANFVTVAMEDVYFKAPASRGDALVIYCKIESTGRSSITIKTKAWVRIPGTEEKKEIIACKFKFVCLKDGKPYSYFRTEQYKAWLNKRMNSSN